jgi:hypothetical protein
MLPMQRLTTATGINRAWSAAVAALRSAAQKIARPILLPKWPAGMCEAQHIDFVAACEGRITWRQYFAKWGENTLTL